MGVQKGLHFYECGCLCVNECMQRCAHVCWYVCVRERESVCVDDVCECVYVIMFMCSSVCVYVSMLQWVRAKSVSVSVGVS